MAKKTFEEWMRAVDVAIAARVGLGSSDLPDCPYRDWYEDGKTPAGAASAAIKAANE